MSGYLYKSRMTLLLALVLIMAWSFIKPHDYLTWWMEALPVLIGLAILIPTYKKFPLTDLLYVLLFLHAIVLLVGAHYTYARVPAFTLLQDEFGWSRNPYDKVGHFMQGFVPAMVARELLLRTSPLKSGKWMFTIIVMGCLGIAAIYEIIEWGAAMATGEAAEAFLGTQGDVWDSQKDMAWAGIGAIMALLMLGKKHDSMLKKMK